MWEKGVGGGSRGSDGWRAITKCQRRKQIITTTTKEIEEGTKEKTDMKNKDQTFQYVTKF